MKEKMRPEFRFYIKVFENGQQHVHSQSNIPNTDYLGMILGQFGHSIKEMKWFKKEFEKELEFGTRKSWGHNIMAMYIDTEYCEIYFEGEYERHQSIPTELIIRYINRSLEFLEKYHSNKIPGLQTKLLIESSE